MTTEIIAEVKEPGGKTGRTLRDHIWEVLKPTQEQWDDWKWHFRNRMNTVEKLSRVLPLSQTQKKQLELVSGKYPFSITPYYLSLVKAENILTPVCKCIFQIFFDSKIIVFAFKYYNCSSHNTFVNFDV